MKESYRRIRRHEIKKSMGESPSFGEWVGSALLAA